MQRLSLVRELDNHLRAKARKPRNVHRQICFPISNNCGLSMQPTSRWRDSACTYATTRYRVSPTSNGGYSELKDGCWMESIRYHYSSCGGRLSGNNPHASHFINSSPNSLFFIAIYILGQLSLTWDDRDHRAYLCLSILEYVHTRWSYGEKFLGRRYRRHITKLLLRLTESLRMSYTHHMA